MPHLFSNLLIHLKLFLLKLSKSCDKIKSNNDCTYRKCPTNQSIHYSKEFLSNPHLLVAIIITGFNNFFVKSLNLSVLMTFISSTIFTRTMPMTLKILSFFQFLFLLCHDYNLKILNIRMLHIFNLKLFFWEE